MQRVKLVNSVFFCRCQLIWFLFLITGCENGTSISNASSEAKPFQGTHLSFSCPDSRLRSLYEPMIRVWRQHTGAEVEIRAEPFAASKHDLGIVAFVELGTPAANGELVPVPHALREPGSPYLWSSVLGAYRGEAYAGWGGQTLGLPLAADGFLIVYRTDRFTDSKTQAVFHSKFNRKLAAPTTWEEFADIASFFADRDKRPSLPRMACKPDEPACAIDWFFRVAACYDRPATSESLSFQFDIKSGKARIEGPGFIAAAQWLQGLKLRNCLPESGGVSSPAAALKEDRAVLAVLSLDDLMRLKQAGQMPARYGIAPLPGTGQVANANGKLVPTPSNYVPYHAGGWLGVVSRKCPATDAAFALLAELGGPARCQEIIAAGGFGPLRDSHLEGDRAAIWLGYGFDKARTKALQESLRAYVTPSVRNPTYAIRTPDRAKLGSLLLGEMSRIVGGQENPESGLRRAAEAWNKASAADGSSAALDWRRKSAGLN